MDSEVVTTAKECPESAIAPLSRPLKLEEMDWNDPSLSKEELDRICGSVNCGSAPEATGEPSSKKARLMGFGSMRCLKRLCPSMDILKEGTS
jgi:hypothetical protein